MTLNSNKNFRNIVKISKNVQPIFLPLNLHRPQIYHQENTLTESQKVKKNDGSEILRVKRFWF